MRPQKTHKVGTQYIVKVGTTMATLNKMDSLVCMAIAGRETILIDPKDHHPQLLVSTQDAHEFESLLNSPVDTKSLVLGAQRAADMLVGRQLKQHRAEKLTGQPCRHARFPNHGSLASPSRRSHGSRVGH